MADGECPGGRCCARRGDHTLAPRPAPIFASLHATVPLKLHSRLSKPTPHSRRLYFVYTLCLSS